jgi:SET domain-containing protein
VVRRSRIAQLGVYTREPLAAGELVVEYGGEVVRASVRAAVCFWGGGGT